MLKHAMSHSVIRQLLQSDMILLSTECQITQVPPYIYDTCVVYVHMYIHTHVLYVYTVCTYISMYVCMFQNCSRAARHCSSVCAMHMKLSTVQHLCHRCLEEFPVLWYIALHFQLQLVGVSQRLLHVFQVIVSPFLLIDGQQLSA